MGFHIAMLGLASIVKILLSTDSAPVLAHHGDNGHFRRLEYPSSSARTESNVCRSSMVTGALVVSKDDDDDEQIDEAISPAIGEIQ